MEELEDMAICRVCLSITALVPESECWYYIETHKWYKDADDFLALFYGIHILYYLLLFLFIQVLYICLYSLLCKVLNRTDKKYNHGISVW